MRINYTLTFSEYRRRLWLSLCQAFRGKPLLLIFCAAGIVFMLFAPAALMLQEYLTSPIPVPPSLLHSEVFTALSPFFELPIFLAIVLPIGWLLNRRGWVMTSPDGIRYRDGLFKWQLSWRVVGRIDEDDQYIYLGGNPSFYRSASFVMIPKRTFASPADAEAFFQQAVTYWSPLVRVDTPAISNTWPPAPRVG